MLRIFTLRLCLCISYPVLIRPSVQYMHTVTHDSGFGYDVQVPLTTESLFWFDLDFCPTLFLSLLLCYLLTLHCPLLVIERGPAPLCDNSEFSPKYRGFNK